MDIEEYYSNAVKAAMKRFGESLGTPEAKIYYAVSDDEAKSIAKSVLNNETFKAGLHEIFQRHSAGEDVAEALADEDLGFIGEFTQRRAFKAGAATEKAVKAAVSETPPAQAAASWASRLVRDEAGKVHSGKVAALAAGGAVLGAGAVALGVWGASERKTEVRPCRATCRGISALCDIHLRQKSARPAWNAVVVAELRSCATAL